LNTNSDIPTKIRSYKYWQIQLLGWSLASVYWAYTVYVKENYSVFHTIVNFFFDVLIGVSLTHVYGVYVNKKLINVFNPRTVAQLIVAIIVLSFLFMLLVNLKWFAFSITNDIYKPDFLTSLFFWDPPFITGLRLMSIWVLAYHLYYYYQQQMTLTIRNAELSILAKQIQLDQLSNQLNPHFLFNSLNSVKSLISENQTKAKRSIDLLSDILRSSLYTKNSMTTIERELQLITDYLELEKLRFEERLQFHQEIDKSTLTCKIPALCIQVLIENAIKHGIQENLNGGLVSLAIKKDERYLKIIVKNPGKLKGYDKVKSIGIGIQNLEKRLQLQYQERASFKLIEESEGIIMAELIIPLA